MVLEINRKEIINIQAPGRICLFGDHQDYLGLPIIACAINRYIYISASSNEDNFLRIIMPDIGEKRIIDLNGPIRSNSTNDHFVSVLKELELEGCIPNRGYDIEIKGTVPVNAGLSSSSAIVVAWVAFLLETFGSDRIVTPEYIAKLAFRAEVLHYNAPGGIMDQYAISIGNLLFLNTVSGDHTIIDNTVQSLIVGESGVPKETLDILSNLKGYALEAIAIVQNKFPDFKIENATIADYNLYKDYVSDKLRPIFFGAIKNYEITKSAFNILSEDVIDLNEVGRLMNEHHAVLKDVLKITVPIIDKMIDGALVNGALGAKIVGSGGGGCIVALTDEAHEKKVIQGILDAGASAAYKVSISDGVKII
jgi:galactokinase